MTVMYGCPPDLPSEWWLKPATWTTTHVWPDMADFERRIAALEALTAELAKKALAKPKRRKAKRGGR